MQYSNSNIFHVPIFLWFIVFKQSHLGNHCSNLDHFLCHFLANEGAKEISIFVDKFQSIFCCNKNGNFTLWNIFETEIYEKNRSIFACVTKILKTYKVFSLRTFLLAGSYYKRYGLILNGSTPMHWTFIFIRKVITSWKMLQSFYPNSSIYSSDLSEQILQTKYLRLNLQQKLKFVTCTISFYCFH